MLAWCSHFSRLGVLRFGLCAITCFIAPHSECPHTTIFATFRTSTAYSIALASERSPIEMPSAVAGGIRFPTLRMMNFARVCRSQQFGHHPTIQKQQSMSVSGD